MIFSSIFYFLYYGAVSFLVPYLALFYQGQGLTGGQIGVLAAIMPLIFIIGAPLWTGTADATRRHKIVAMVAIIGTIITALIFPQIATFTGLILVASIFAFFRSPIGSLTDSATISLLGERREKYGRIRLWGTLGYGMVAPLAGELIGRFGLQWAFWGYAIMMALGLLPVIPIPFRQSHSSGAFFRGMRELFANQSWILFLVMVFIGGVGMATINNYLFIYMEGLGASKSLMGLALMFSTASEIPVLFFGNRFLQRFGARGLLIIAMMTISLRLFAYSLTTVPWIVLIIQLLHGLTFAIILLAGVSYADQVAPAGMKATTQGMFTSTLMGIGAATGGLLGGILMEHFRPAGMYGIFGVVVLISLVVFLFVERKVIRRTNNST